MLLSLYDGWRAFTEVHKEIIFSGFLSVKSEVIIRFFRIFEPHLLYVSFVVLHKGGDSEGNLHAGTLRGVLSEER